MDASATPHRARLPRRLLLAFNIGMAGWFAVSLVRATLQYLAAESDSARTGTLVGTGLGIGALLLVWLLGAMILGGLALAMRRR
ncbi:hypothetical protein GXW74_06310 [Roseomonas eburnea]|uniref:Uncharacterized protein n=1 Tax=Neoroseomonas eburnea TaxID=1346889 RepID=A0A9X9X8Q6_9PROT|nr:hypothetical protein [Neoroseomonas eburnea]MBR0680092.1 hypothetical protein [Neoroseomonas eburnea]